MAALMQNVTNQQSTTPSGNNNQKTNNKKRQPTKEKDSQPSNIPSLHDRRLNLQPDTEINVSTWRPIEYRNSFNQQLRKASVEDRIKLAAMALSRSGNIIVTAKDG